MIYYKYMMNLITDVIQRQPIILSILLIGFMLVLLYLTIRKFLTWRRYKFLTEKNSWALLEIIIPQEIRRSPEAMELFFMNTIWWEKGTSSNKIKKYWKGETRMDFSFEIVSLGGSIHFFIHAPTHLIDLTKSQLYAQYPQIELRSVLDYTDRIPAYVRDHLGIAMFSWEYGFKKPGAYPIRTYRDWGTDRTMQLDLDEQIDPMAAMIEKLASIDPWEEFWVQIGVRIEKDEAWRAEGEAIIDKIITGHRRVVPGTEEMGQRTPMISTLTKGEQEVVDAIDRQTGHMHAFEVAIRSVFLTRRPEQFNANRIGFLKGLFEPFNSHSLNSFKSVNPTGFDNPWEDYNEYLENMLKDRALERYRQREFFGEKPVTFNIWDAFLRMLGSYTPKTLIMTGEELATLFHLPAGFTQSPSVKRTDTKKAQPPSNLPL